MPTNIHEFIDDSQGNPEHSDSDGFEIACLKEQHFSDDFYIYAVEWNSEKIIWYLNNEIVRTVHIDQNYPNLNWPTDSMNVIVTTRVWENEFPNEPDDLPDEWEIDYVRVYQKTPSKSGLISTESISDKLHEDLSGKSEENIKIYPNPSNGIISIEAEANSRVLVTEINGRIVYDKRLELERNKLNLSDLLKGVYFISLTTSDDIFTRKVILQ